MGRIDGPSSVDSQDKIAELKRLQEEAQQRVQNTAEQISQGSLTNNPEAQPISQTRAPNFGQDTDPSSNTTKTLNSNNSTDQAWANMGASNPHNKNTDASDNDKASKETPKDSKQKLSDTKTSTAKKKEAKHNHKSTHSSTSSSSYEAARSGQSFDKLQDHLNSARFSI